MMKIIVSGLVLGRKDSQQIISRIHFISHNCSNNNLWYKHSFFSVILILDVIFTILCIFFSEHYLRIILNYWLAYLFRFRTLEFFKMSLSEMWNSGFFLRFFRNINFYMIFGSRNHLFEISSLIITFYNVRIPCLMRFCWNI